MIRKSDGLEFGLSWYQSTFDKLVAKLMDALKKIYRGNIADALGLGWTLDNVGRLVLSPDEDAIDYLGDQWKINEADESRREELAQLIAE